MAKKRSDRYESVKELLGDLRAVAQGEPPLQAHQRFDATVLADLEKGDAHKVGDTDIMDAVHADKLGLKMAVIILSGMLIIAMVIIITLVFVKPA